MCSEAKAYFRPTEYYKPMTLQEAVQLAAKYGSQAQIVAGATDVLVDCKPGIKALIDITNCGMCYVSDDGDKGLRIGAATTMNYLQKSEALRGKAYHILADAARMMGTPQVRSTATIGGNLCSALPSADMAPALYVLDAKLTITNTNGSRSIPVEKFLLNVRKNDLKEGEILTEVEIPFQAGAKAVFMKMERATEGDLALVNAAVKLIINAENVCEDARIAIGAVAPTPVRAYMAEKIILNKMIDKDLIKKAASLAIEEIKPISDVRASAEYRKHITRVFIERGLSELAGI